MKGAKAKPAEAALLAQNEQWARNIAQSLFERMGPLNGLTIDDFCQAARIGLLKGIRKWTPERGNLRACAAKLVRGEVLEEIRRADDVGRGRRGEGNVPQTCSYEVPFAAGGPSTGSGRVRRIADALVSPVEADRLAARQRINGLLSGLTIQARAVLALVVLEGHSQAEAGDTLGMAESSVSFVLDEALGKLQRKHGGGGEDAPLPPLPKDDPGRSERQGRLFQDMEQSI